MADLNAPLGPQTGEVAYYRHNAAVLQFITKRKFHDSSYVMSDNEYATAIADPINLQFARAITVRPNGVADVHLRAIR
jgi:hypothetical protein